MLESQLSSYVEPDLPMYIAESELELKTSYFNDNHLTLKNARTSVIDALADSESVAELCDKIRAAMNKKTGRKGWVAIVRPSAADDVNQLRYFSNENIWIIHFDVRGFSVFVMR